MLMDFIYLVTFILAFMGPAMLFGAIFEYVYYTVLGHNPDEDYHDV